MFYKGQQLEADGLRWEAIVTRHLLHDSLDSSFFTDRNLFDQLGIQTRLRSHR